jgi:hypothetical protein
MNMRKFVLFCASLFAMVLLISSSPVQAQTVLWVSATGSGTTCSTAAPCGTFQAAVTAGATEIHCLNSGNYGPVTISASIIIDCGTGNVGTISISGGSNSAISISGSPTVIVRHLSLNGNGSAAVGISANVGGGTLVVEDSEITGFNTGIFFIPNSARGLLQVSNSRAINNTNAIYVFPQSGQIASVTLNRVEVTGNSGNGLTLDGAVVAGTMRDSVVGANGVGVFASASQVYFTVEESSIVANPNYGIRSTTAGTVLDVGNSTLGGNGTAISAASGSINSFGNNQISANGSNGNFTSIIALR